MKRIYTEIPPATVCLLRHLTIWALLSAYCWLTKQSVALPKQDRLKILLGGFVAMGLYMIPFLEGLKLTSSTNCAIILATSPIFTILLAWMTGQEKSSVWILLGSGVAFTGVATVIAGVAHTAHTDSLFGDGLVLASSVIWAASTVMMRPLLTRYNPLPLFTMSLPGALPILLPYGIYSMVKHPVTHISPETAVLLGHVTILSGVIAFVGFYSGLSRVGATTTTMYQFCIAPTAAFFSWLYLRQQVTFVQLGGIVIVVAGVWCVSMARQRLLSLEASA